VRTNWPHREFELETVLVVSAIAAATNQRENSCRGRSEPARSRPGHRRTVIVMALDRNMQGAAVAKPKLMAPTCEEVVRHGHEAAHVHVGRGHRLNNGETGNYESRRHVISALRGLALTGRTAYDRMLPAQTVHALSALATCQKLAHCTAACWRPYASHACSMKR